MFLARDVQEHRSTINVTITTFFPLCFKMAESDKEITEAQKKSCRGIAQVRKQGKRMRKQFPL